MNAARGTRRPHARRPRPRPRKSSGGAGHNGCLSTVAFLAVVVLAGVGAWGIVLAAGLLLARGLAYTLGRIT